MPWGCNTKGSLIGRNQTLACLWACKWVWSQFCSQPSLFWRKQSHRNIAWLSSGIQTYVCLNRCKCVWEQFCSRTVSCLTARMKGRSLQHFVVVVVFALSLTICRAKALYSAWQWLSNRGVLPPGPLSEVGLQECHLVFCIWGMHLVHELWRLPPNKC